jgi:AcrR family transcriptional regulator
MGRWQPDAHGRLVQAALELFQELGYDRTTVEGIAARAGLTERTFFRYFTDKREVLFSGAALLERLIVEAMASAPKGMAPLDVVATGLQAASAMFEARRSHARTRNALIAAHAELHERELIKLAGLAVAIAASLRKRGVADPAATLAADAGIAVFKHGFARWLADPGRQELAQHLSSALADFRTATAPAVAVAIAPPPPRARKAVKKRR